MLSLCHIQCLPRSRNFKKSRQHPNTLLLDKTQPGRTTTVATSISIPVTSSISATVSSKVSRPVTSSISTTAATSVSRPMTSSISTTVATTISRPVTSSISFLLAEEEQQDYQVRKTVYGNDGWGKELPLHLCSVALKPLHFTTAL